MRAQDELLVAQLVKDLQQLGVTQGSAVMVHASLRAIGPVMGRANGVLDALDEAVGPRGGLLMVMGSLNEWHWVNERPESEREVLLGDAVPFDVATTPVDSDVGYLAEAFRQRGGTLVSNNPEGRFGARGGLAEKLLENAPWDDYFGPGSPLAKLCELDGYVLRLGADPDTITLLHYAEYVADLATKRRVRRHRLVLGATGPIVRAVECLDDDEGIADYAGVEYFIIILNEFLLSGQTRLGMVGGAKSELINAREFVTFAAKWMEDNLE